MKKLLFTLIALASSVFGYETIIVSNPDHVDIMSTIITGVKHFLGGGSDANTFYSLASLVVVVGTVWVLIRLMTGALSGDFKGGFKSYFIYLVMLMGVSMLLYGPKTQVLIATKPNVGVSSAYNTIDDVPYFLSFVTSMFTNIQYSLGEISKTAFNIPMVTDNFPAGGVDGLGFSGAAASLAKMSQNANFKISGDPELQDKYAQYVQDCVMLPLSAKGDDAVMRRALKSTDLMTDIAPGQMGDGAEFIRYNGVTIRCNDFWNGGANYVAAFGAGTQGLKDTLEDFKDDTNGTGGGRRAAEIGGALRYYGTLMNSATAMAATADVQQAVLQSVMSNEFASAYNKLGVAGDVAQRGASMAMAQAQLESMNTAAYYTTWIPRLSFMFFALMVASSPFLLLFALLPGSGSILINFLRTLVWVTLWEPMSSIIGVFMDSHLAKVYKENGITTLNDVAQISTENLIDVSSEAAALAAAAGVLYAGIQGISWMLMTGSGQMLGNVLSGVAGNIKQTTNADTQMAAQQQIAGAALASQELGRDIGVAEMNYYRAMQQSADSASQVAGTQHAYGASGSRMAQSMTHTNSVNTANSLGNQQATARVLGSGSKAASVGRVMGSKSAGAMVKEAEGMYMNEELAEMLGGFAGTATANQAIGNAEGNDWDSNTVAQTARKSSRLSAKTSATAMGGMKDSDIDDAGTHAGTTQSSQMKSQVSAAKKQHPDDWVGGLSKSIAASTEHDTLTQLQRGDNLDAMEGESDKLARNKANMMEKKTLEAINNFKNENPGMTTDQALKAMETNAATVEGSQLNATHKSIKRVGKDSFIKNQATEAIKGTMGLDAAINEVGSEQYIADGITTAKGQAANTRATIMDAQDKNDPTDFDGSKGYVKGMVGKGKDAGANLSTYSEMADMSTEEMQNLANNESIKKGVKARISGSNEMSAQLAKQKFTEDMDAISNDTSKSGTERLNAIKDAIKDYNKSAPDHHKIDENMADEIDSFMQDDYNSGMQEMADRIKGNNSKIAVEKDRIKQRNKNRGMYEKTKGSGYVDKANAESQQTIQSLEEENGHIQATIDHEYSEGSMAQQVLDGDKAKALSSFIGASSSNAFSTTGSSESNILSAVGANEMNNFAGTVGSGSFSIQNGAGSTANAMAQMGAGATAAKTATAQTLSNNGGVTQNMSQTATYVAQKDANANSIRQHLANVMPQKIAQDAGNDPEAMAFYSNLGMFSENPAERMAAVDALSMMGGQTMVNGRNISYGVDEFGEIMQHYVSSKSGVDIQHKHNVDYGNAMMTSATENMSVQNQIYSAGAKSVVSDAIEFTPFGRAMKVAKRANSLKAGAKSLRGSINSSAGGGID